MKQAITFLAIAITLAACTSSKDGASSSGTFDTTKVASGKKFYQCPMHAEVLSAEAGECPKCGMALESVMKK